MSTSFNWSRFVVRINVNAPMERLYEAWATKAGIEYWFLRESEYRMADGSLLGNDEFVSPGDSYRWRWHGYPDSSTEEGTILAANGRDKFVFVFGNAGTCTVNIRKEQGETIVELVQEAIPEDEKGRQQFHVGCKTGWTFYLANLKSMMEGGIDLRNRNEKLQEMLNS